MSEPFVGEIRMFAGNFAPRGWALCDGQLLAISSNDALFSLLGTIYGGDGRTTFALPELRGRIPVHAGAGTGPGLSQRRPGEKSGSEGHTVVVSELPSHSHAFQATEGTATTRDPVGNAPAEASADTYVEDLTIRPLASPEIGQTGGSQVHTNLMPAVCLTFIIALVGIYPSRN